MLRTCIGISIGISFLWMIFFGFTFGERKSFMLLLAMIYILFMDAVVIQTFLLLARNYVYRFQIEVSFIDLLCSLYKAEL